MATKVKEWDFSRQSGRESKYPWDKWTDGSIWKVEQGEGKDFACKPSSFRSALQAQATKLSEDGKKVKVRATVLDTEVVFQFIEDEG